MIVDLDVARRRIRVSLMRPARLPEGLVLTDVVLIPDAQISFEWRRLRERAAGGSIGIGERGDRLAVYTNEVRRISQVAAIPCGGSRRRQPMCDTRHDFRLHAPHPVDGAVHNEIHVPEATRIEQTDLDVLPVFLINRAVEL